MVFAIETGSDEFEPARAGIFIPVSDLPGVEAAELDEANADAKDKGVMAFVYRVWEFLNQPAASPLGMSLARGNLLAQGQDLVRQQFTFTTTIANKLDSGTVGLLPVPSTGANAGVGRVALNAIFPNMIDGSAGLNDVPAGIVIATPGNFADTLTPGASVSTQSRPWLTSFFMALGTESQIRSGTEASGIVTRSLSNAVGQAPLAAWTQANDPTTGLVAADLPKYKFYNLTVASTFEKKLNFTAQTFDLNRVTA